MKSSRDRNDKAMTIVQTACQVPPRLLQGTIYVPIEGGFALTCRVLCSNARSNMRRTITTPHVRIQPAVLSVLCESAGFTICLRMRWPFLKLRKPIREKLKRNGTQHHHGNDCGQGTRSGGFLVDRRSVVRTYVLEKHSMYVFI